jgi:hypothetical protein
VEGCSFRAKHPDNIAKHKLITHNNNAVWRHCTYEGCDFKSRLPQALKEHMKEHLRKELKDERLGLEKALKEGTCGICNTALEDSRCSKCNINLEEKISQLAKKEEKEEAEAKRMAVEFRMEVRAARGRGGEASARGGPRSGITLSPLSSSILFIHLPLSSSSVNSFSSPPPSPPLTSQRMEV